MKLHPCHERCNIAGVRIRARREELGLSQEQLASKLQLLGLEIGQKAISRAETGARVIPDYELPFYAAALGVPILWLLGQEA